MLVFVTLQELAVDESMCPSGHGGSTTWGLRFPLPFLARIQIERWGCCKTCVDAVLSQERTLIRRKEKQLRE